MFAVATDRVLPFPCAQSEGRNPPNCDLKARDQLCPLNVDLRRSFFGDEQQLRVDSSRRVNAISAGCQVSDSIH
jgi:hypothetical protein